jgi:hypothetical protein
MFATYTYCNHTYIEINKQASHKAILNLISPIL